MAKKSPQQRQKARQRKLEKQKQKRSQHSPSTVRIGGRRILPRSAGEWPLLEAWLHKDWRDTMQIHQILVARRGPAGQIGVGSFVVDLGCLGVKNAFGYQLDPEEYRNLLSDMKSRQKMVQVDLNLVAKVLREGIAYAEALGFKPHRDYRQAAPILGNADPDACTEEIPLGKDGKPFYFSGPYDNVDAILAQLRRAVGPDGFTFMLRLGGPMDDFVD